MKTEEKKKNTFSDPISDWASKLMNAVLTEGDKEASTLPIGYSYKGMNASFTKRDEIMVGFVFSCKGAVR